MFEKIISSHYLLLLLKIDPNQPSALVNSNLLNIRNVYSSFITINREAHIWYQEVYHALEKIQFAGSLGTNGLLIKGPKKSLTILKRIFCQRLLQAPFGFLIGDLGESNFHVEIKRQLKQLKRENREKQQKNNAKLVDEIPNLIRHEIYSNSIRIRDVQDEDLRVKQLNECNMKDRE